MDELMYESLVSYFSTLASHGYCKYSTVDKILVIMYIQEMFVNEFKYYMTEKDVKLMQDLLYQFIGSTCEISFPSNNKCCCGTSSIPEPDPEPEPTEGLYAYSGWADTMENIDVSIGVKIPIIDDKFSTAVGENFFVWFAFPASKVLESAISSSFKEDDITDEDDNFHQLENVFINGIEYKLYCYEFLGFVDNNIYDVTLSNP